MFMPKKLLLLFEIVLLLIFDELILEELVV